MKAEPRPVLHKPAIRRSVIQEWRPFSLGARCRVIDPAFTWAQERRPGVPWEETVIYEMHVKGFSKLNHHIPEAERGTFAALTHASAAQYLGSLGVTAA